MSELWELPREIATAFFFAAAIGVATGAVVAGRTQRVAPALPVAFAAFAIAGASFAYAIWRNHCWCSRSPDERALEERPVVPAQR